MIRRSTMLMDPAGSASLTSSSSSSSRPAPQSTPQFKFIIPQMTPPKAPPKFKWSSHSLPSKEAWKRQAVLQKAKDAEMEKKRIEAQQLIKDAQTTTSSGAAASTQKKKRRTLRPRKAVISLSPKAIAHLKALLDEPEPRMIRVSTRNRGCSGTTYDLQYVTKPEKFDEVVEQDGIKIVIDSRALFSVVGSEMDWIDDKLNTKFVFKNPNSKGTCGCGESFMV
ncbi:Fe-binding Fe/S cluster assembly protein ISA1 KNAG_0I03060 [Huiozyma naganishii CBS 8797]|uniref:Iron-sulfur assembly protein 1 n=1 Tax=Huiozyma naganishii (strain ATCC MYA-139 / BCRC 22969 / CBS 8797 / KCTC 17520 / NBRC 10181 / NCYC 3082 / Yp74L-3) TaxID=1071383 RepID=J7RB37_HUIN7|nr:hypothetical protein KNAG_0I03060 [Kazachstania naganishii CBS 8797]CCK72090.1 hypothetical protein KNAG_0I03060 [Kazachstania naganishii CBS 8797]